MKLIDIPKTCPECGRVFARADRPRQRMQVKAKMVVLAGVLLTCAWMVLLTGVFYAWRLTVVPRSIEELLGMAAVVLAPGTLLGGWAIKMPRVARRKCPKCPWYEDYVIDGVR
ncbi:MAG: hypothetical protein K8T25_18430 [Planctomycetia bacterium]|nr:hypothetical protein [Planctomycetia bacterium]